MKLLFKTIILTLILPALTAGQLSAYSGAGSPEQMHHQAMETDCTHDMENSGGKDGCCTQPLSSTDHDCDNSNCDQQICCVIMCHGLLFTAKETDSFSLYSPKQNAHRYYPNNLFPLDFHSVWVPPNIFS